MALRKEDWLQFMLECNIPSAEAEKYAETLVNNRVQEASDLSKELLHDLGIIVIGDVLAIIRNAKLKSHDQKPHHSALEHSEATSKSKYKPSNATLPKVNPEMTHPEYRKFQVDWEVFKRRTCLPEEQIAAELYSACDSTVQNAIINTCDNFFELNEKDILSKIEQIVTKRSNPAVHRLNFSKLLQAENESISDFLVRLKSTA